MSGGPHTILVTSDQTQLLWELVGKARQIADPLGWEVAVLALEKGSALDAKALGEAGADRWYRLEGNGQPDGNPETSLAILCEAIRRDQPALVLIGASKQGMEIAPRAAERFGSGYGPWAVEVEIDPGTCQASARCGLYSGQGLASYRFKTRTTLFTIAQGVFKRQAVPARTVQELTLPAPQVPARIQVIETRPKEGGSTRIEEAQAVVDVGQGVKQREDLALVNAVAEWFGGQLGCSRPVSSDRDWFPEWLGLSGKKVSPELCLTVGVSGAIQHVIGIRDSRVIVAVNNDENAGIFSQVDYGVVADLYAFLPVFLERLKARHVRPVWKA